MSMSFPQGSQSHESYSQSNAKRRRLRKGTFSCWECKRRKMRCIFDPLNSTTSATSNVCQGCRARGSQCISQEFPEVGSSPRESTITAPQLIFRDGDGQVRVESRCSESEGNSSGQRALTTPPNEDSRGLDQGISIPTPVSDTAEPSTHVNFYTSSEVSILMF